MNSILVAGIGIASLLASTVVLGMAYLDMKKHKVNVKDRSSAVIFVARHPAVAAQLNVRP